MKPRFLVFLVLLSGLAVLAISQPPAVSETGAASAAPSAPANSTAKARLPLGLAKTSGSAIGIAGQPGQAVRTPTPGVAAKSSSLPFKSNVVSVDKAHRSFRMGKRKIRLVRVVTSTKLFRGDGVTPAAFEELVPGVELRGALRRLENGAFEAISLKIGQKRDTASPQAAEEGDSIP